MANVVVTMSGDEARLWRAQQKIYDQQLKLENKFKSTEKASEQAGRVASTSFDKTTSSVGKLSASLVTYASGVATITGAVALLGKAWTFVVDEQKEALRQLERTAPQDRRLLQVSGNAQEFEQLRAQADQLAGQFGVDRATVREVIFSAVSENFRDAVPAIIAANQVIDPVSAAGVAGQGPALFKGTIGALEAVNLTLKAAQASRLDFEQIAASLPQAAEGGSIAKATAEETLAVLSVLASEFKSGDTAADRIKMFATRAGISEEFAGKGIIEPLEKLMAMDEKARRAYLGDSQELNVAYVKLAENIELIKKRVQEFNQERVDFAAGGGLLASQVEIANTDPRFAALVRAQGSRQALEVSQATEFGVTGGTAEAAANAARSSLVNRNFWTRFVADQSAGLITNASVFLGADQETAANIAATAAEQSAISKMLEFGKMLVEAAGRLDSASARMGNTTNPARAQANTAGGF